MIHQFNHLVDEWPPGKWLRRLKNPSNDVPVIRALLQQLVSGYQPSGEMVDCVHLANLREVVNED